MSKKWTNKEIKFLRKYYKKKGGKWCAKKLKRNLGGIYVKRFKLKIKGKNCNQKYDNIEGIFSRKNLTSNIAYILGNSIADVNIRNRSKNKGHSYRLKYEISGEPGKYRDNYALLMFIRKHISPERPIKKREQWDKRYGKYYKKLILEISGLDKLIVRDLKYWGIIERKTGEEFLPPIPNKYFYAWLLGLFDGDGHLAKDGYQRNIIASSKSFLEDIQKKYSGLIGSKELIGVIYHDKESKSVRKKKDGGDLKDRFYWRIYNMPQISQMAHFIYQDNGFCFRRKKKRFIKAGLLEI